MARPSKYSPELRERIPHGLEHTHEHPSQWATIDPVGSQPRELFFLSPRRLDPMACHLYPHGHGQCGIPVSTALQTQRASTPTAAQAEMLNMSRTQPLSTQRRPTPSKPARSDN